MFSSLLNFIAKHDIITIFSHIYPDGDSLGSVIGMRELIKTNYPHKHVYAISDTHETFNKIVGPLDSVSDEVIAKSAALILDVADGARVSDQRFKLAHDSFKVDHHIFAEDFTNGALILNDHIAVCEIIGEFIMAENLTINAQGATALALGIITDSGRFFYDLTSALTFKVMGMLLDNGADLKLINDVLSSKKLEGLKTRGYFMSNYEIDHSVVYIHLDFPTLQAFGLKASEGSAFVNMFGNYDNYPVWATFFTDADGITFCELRSKSRNVQQVAKDFGGGGHLKASGCRLQSVDQIPALLEALNNAKELD